MKSRYLFGLSFLALAILIGVQYIFITETYRTKQKQFDSRYGELIRDGMREFNSLNYNFGFDSVLFILDNMAVEYLYASTDTFTISPGEAFHRILSDYRESEDFIAETLKKAGEDPAFSYHLELEELFLVDISFQKRVYPDSLLLPAAPPGSLLAGSFTHERNFFRISYNVYCNFTNRSSLILRDMWLILSLAVFTILLVFAVFFLTLRNMLRQTRLSDMKTDFINNMTHELKTPLSTISVASSSLGNKAILQNEQKVEELSQVIKRQNRHLTDLIDRILDINILEKDRVRIRPERVEIGPWITELVDTFLLDRQKEAPEIDLQLKENMTDCLLDRVHMSNAVNNLLSNAVKYGNPPYLIRLEVSCTDERLRISVSDNGPGIRKDDMKHIFDKFYRGEESRERVIKGLGLGLYYVKQIAEAHGGTVVAKSTPGKGSVFIIETPIQNGLIAG